MDSSPTPVTPEPAPGASEADGHEARMLLMRQLIHDLNNALSVITINVTLLGQDDCDEEEAADLLQEVARAGAKASTIRPRASTLPC